MDEYMIYEAKVLGASAFLLIYSILSEAEIRAYIKAADELGLSSLVEVHDEDKDRSCLDRKRHQGEHRRALRHRLRHLPSRPGGKDGRDLGRCHRWLRHHKAFGEVWTICP